MQFSQVGLKMTCANDNEQLRPCSTGCAIGFPVFNSYKALHTGDPVRLTSLTVDWIVLGCMFGAEQWMGWALRWCGLRLLIIPLLID